jgi:hypothetical protein
MKTLKQIREASGGKEAYQKFFNSLLKKFGVSSPSELEGKKKKDFFDAIDKGWDGDNEPKEKGESVKEGKKLKGGKGKAELDINWDGSAKDVKFAATKYKIKIKPHRDGAIITGDKQKLLAFLQGQDYAMDPEDIEDLYPEVLETYDDPDDLDPETTHNPDEVPLAKKAKEIITSESKDFSQAQEVTEKDTLAERGKEQRLSSAHKNQIHKIARKHSGDMEAAIKEIEKMKIWKGQGIKDHSYVMDVLRQHNESLDLLGTGDTGSSESVNETTIHISNEISEKIKAGKGKDSVGTDVDWDNVGDEKKWIKQAKSKYKVTIKKDVGKYHSGAEISGKKADIIKFLQGPMYGGVDDRDIEDMWPSLVEAVDCDGRLLGFKAATRRKEGEKQTGKVIVDRRTKGYKEAQVRREKAAAKRLEAKKQKEFEEKYPKIEYNRGTKKEDTALMKRLNKAFEIPETAANAASAGGVDMAPNAGKKKKDKFKVVKRANY